MWTKIRNTSDNIFLWGKLIFNDELNIFFKFINMKFLVCKKPCNCKNNKIKQKA